MLTLLVAATFLRVALASSSLPLDSCHRTDSGSMLHYKRRKRSILSHFTITVHPYAKPSKRCDQRNKSTHYTTGGVWLTRTIQTVEHCSLTYNTNLKHFRNVRRVHRFILCLNYMRFPVVLYFSPPSFESVLCYICGRRRVAVARYRMICLVLIKILDYETYMQSKGDNRFPD